MAAAKTPKNGKRIAYLKRKDLTGKDRRREMLRMWLYEKLTYEEIGKHYGLTKQAVEYQVNRAIPELAAEFGQELAVDVKKEAMKQFRRAERLWNAAEQWLEFNGEIDLDPRATEVSVIYLDPTDIQKNGEPRQKKAKLQELLDMVMGDKVMPQFAIVKTMDLRKFALESVSCTDKTLDTLAKLLGEYVKEKPNPADSVEVARKFVARAIEKGANKDEAVEYAVANYGILESDLIGV